MASLASAIYSFCTKWESKLLQFQELKKKEEKFGKPDSKQRMSSGSTAGNNPATASTAAVTEKASTAEKQAQGKISSLSLPGPNLRNFIIIQALLNIFL
jgi:hypothetical protein